MSKGLFGTAAILALCMSPIAAQAQGGGGAVPGAVGGAAAGAAVGGPVGAVVGGAAGAALGGALTADQSAKVRQYVVTHKRPSVRVTERVNVGEPLPSSVEIYELPADVGVQQYRYTVVNDQTVLVDPSSRRVVQIIQ